MQDRKSPEAAEEFMPLGGGPPKTHATDPHVIASRGPFYSGGKERTIVGRQAGHTPGSAGGG